MFQKKNSRYIFGSESEDLEIASEEPASAIAPAAKDIGVSPTEERLKKLEIPFSKVAEHAGLVEDESSSEDA